MMCLLNLLSICKFIQHSQNLRILYYYLQSNKSFFKMDTTQKHQYSLFTYFRSSTAWRVRIALNLKKINVDYKYVNLSKGEQNNEEYLKINPNHAVPALVINKDNSVIIESVAIIEYLEEAHPDTYQLLPKDPVLKAKIRGFCEVINSGIHPYHNLRLLNIIGDEFKGDKIAFSKRFVDAGLTTLQKILVKNEGKYSFGDEITNADVFLYPTVKGGVDRFGVDLSQYPRIKAVFEELQKVEEFVRAQPKNQPDYKQ